MSWISDHFVWLPNSETTNQQLLSLRSFCCTSFSYFWSDQWPTTSSCSHHSSMDSFQDQSGVLYIPESFPLNSKPRWQEVLGYLIKVIELRMSCPPPPFGGQAIWPWVNLENGIKRARNDFLSPDSFEPRGTQNHLETSFLPGFYCWNRILKVNSPYRWRIVAKIENKILDHLTLLFSPLWNRECP